MEPTIAINIRSTTMTVSLAEMLETGEVPRQKSDSHRQDDDELQADKQVFLPYRDPKNDAIFKAIMAKNLAHSMDNLIQKSDKRCGVYAANTGRRLTDYVKSLNYDRRHFIKSQNNLEDTLKHELGKINHVVDKKTEVEHLSDHKVVENIRRKNAKVYGNSLSSHANNNLVDKPSKWLSLARSELRKIDAKRQVKESREAFLNNQVVTWPETDEPNDISEEEDVNDPSENSSDESGYSESSVTLRQFAKSKTPGLISDKTNETLPVVRSDVRRQVTFMVNEDKSAQRSTPHFKSKSVDISERFRNGVTPISTKDLFTKTLQPLKLERAKTIDDIISKHANKTSNAKSNGKRENGCLPQISTKSRSLLTSAVSKESTTDFVTTPTWRQRATPSMLQRNARDTKRIMNASADFMQECQREMLSLENDRLIHGDLKI